MKLSKTIALILALLLALVFGLLIFVKEGGCDRDDGGEEPEPACKPGDNTCKVDEPAPPPAPPPIGGNA